MKPRISPLPFLTFVALAALTVAVLVARWRLLSTLSINWDEFHFLSQIYAHQRGELTAKLLTFHVHLLSWVTAGREGNDNEADQVIVIRHAMFVCSLVTATCVGFIAWRLWRSATAAVFVVFIGQAVSYVLNHGAAARFDPLVTMFVAIAAVALILKLTPDVRSTTRWPSIVAGVALGVGAVISIKIALFLPALVALLLTPLLIGRVSRAVVLNAALDIVLMAATSIAVFASLYAWHVSQLASATSSKAAASSTSSTSLAELFTRQIPGELIPNPDYLIATLRFDVGFWLLFAAGVALAFVAIGRRASTDAFRVLCFMLPLATVALYRNAFSYYFAGILPFAAMLCGFVVVTIERRFQPKKPLIAALLVVLIAVPSALRARSWIAFNSEDEVAPQRATIAAVHAVFPQPTRYIDRCGMIGSFPKSGPFMTTFVLERYRAEKKPIMPALLKDERPEFLVQNVETLELGKPYSGREPRRLLKDDFIALREAFIPHWGPLWVAGKTITLQNLKPTSFNIAIAGKYVVETSGVGAAEVLLDGQQVKAGSNVELAAGAHSATIRDANDQREGEAQLTLRIATAKKPPDAKPPATRTIFGSLGFRGKK